MIAAIIALHVAALYGLAVAFAPDMTASVQRTVVSAFTVTVTAPADEPPPAAQPQPDEGAAGDPGKQAVPRPVAAPTPRVVVKPETPLPPASADGSQNTSGARQSGDGTGAAGSGVGTGSGQGGNGTGGGSARKPELIATITDARAFPVPPGGRKARIGKSVIVRLSVSAQGVPTQCSVYRPSPFPETDRVVCDLALRQVRFKPALDHNGNTVASTFYYKQEFFN
jgi:protein TonB